MKPKSVTLDPGRWAYVCPCGFPTRSVFVPRRESKWLCYCFHCKQSNGKYYKVMDERLEFGTNPNGVLLCGCFPMVRLHHPVRNVIGAVKQIYLKGVWRGNARIVWSEQLTLDGITNSIARLCSGLDAETYRRKIRESLRGRPGINWATQQLDFLVLEYIKETREPKLF